MLINTEQRYSDEGGETQPRLCDPPPPGNHLHKTKYQNVYFSFPICYIWSPPGDIGGKKYSVATNKRVGTRSYSMATTCVGTR